MVSFLDLYLADFNLDAAGKALDVSLLVEKYIRTY
jgi:hypothetical protein